MEKNIIEKATKVICKANEYFKSQLKQTTLPDGSFRDVTVGRNDFPSSILVGPLCNAVYTIYANGDGILLFVSGKKRITKRNIGDLQQNILVSVACYIVNNWEDIKKSVEKAKKITFEQYITKFDNFIV